MKKFMRLLFMLKQSYLCYYIPLYFNIYILYDHILVR